MRTCPENSSSFWVLGPSGPRVPIWAVYHQHPHVLTSPLKAPHESTLNEPTEVGASIKGGGGWLVNLKYLKPMGTLDPKLYKPSLVRAETCIPTL